jgi:phosphoglucosamine mutase
MTLRFGTDGVRGHADELTDELVVALGRAAGRVLAADLRRRPDQRFVIGRDPRESGPRIEDALIDGLSLEGVDVEVVGVAPTPAIAWIAAARDVPAAMISASHNPFHDNGVKFFSAGGRKLTDDLERQLEVELDEALRHPAALRSSDARPSQGEDDLERYELAVLNSIEGRSLDGLSIVVDCANGAASSVAPRTLERLGATVQVLNAHPDGRNINDRCGSTHPDVLQAAVLAERADVGLAFDGDADRVLAVAEDGSLVDGDQLIAMCAIDLQERGRLARDTVVVTVMTNLGFRLAMEKRGIEVVVTPVGDRQVLEALEQGPYSLGGEQSGHVIFRELATTGDGLLTGVQLLDLVRRCGEPLSRLAADAMTRLPQVLKNVEVTARRPDIVDAIAADIAAVEASLGARARVLVRPSGTEPLVRVMVEADDPEAAERAADHLSSAVRRACGA